MVTVQVQFPDLMGKPLLSRKEVEHLVCFPVILINARAAGWIAPLAKSGNNAQGNEIYTRKSVDALLSRLVAGDMPPAAKRAGKGGEA